MGLALGAVVVTPAAAQSTIFNIPTTDTVAPKKGYFEIDYLPQTPGPDEGDSFQIYTPRIVVGIAPTAEVGVNFANTRVGGETFQLFQPNAKYKFYADDANGLAAAAGIIGYIASDDLDSFGQVYGEVSKKVMSGARFTAGLWSSVSYGDDNVAGVLLGYEQPVRGRLSIVADWFSGKNFWGYFTPGISVTLPRNGLLNIGYSLGNDSFEDPGNHNRALFVYYGITFP
jgi:hypothetical protein